MTDDVLQPLRSHRLSLSQRAQLYLRRLIEDGTYQPGEQLPSQNELAAQLGISRPTLREALFDLEREGVIVSRHGVGTFVAPGFGHRLQSGLERLESILELAARQGMQLGFSALQVQPEPADPELAKRLQVAAGTLLTCVRRVIRADGRPVAYMSDVVLSSFLSPADVDETFNGSVLDLLRRKQDLQAAQVVADIVAVNAEPLLARKLRVKPGQALLLLEETLFDVEGTAVEFSRNYFVPDYFQFHVVRR